MSSYSVRRTIIGQLGQNADLYDGITRIAREHGVRIGRVTGIGKGGHLLPGGTPVFACELCIEEYEGLHLTRVIDERTGLPYRPREQDL